MRKRATIGGLKAPLSFHIDISFKDLGLESKAVAKRGMEMRISNASEVKGATIFVQKQLMDYFKNNNEYVIKHILDNARRNILLTISDHLKTNRRGTRGWSQQYRKWRRLAEARGVPVVGNVRHTFTGKFRHSMKTKISKMLKEPIDLKYTQRGQATIAYFDITLSKQLNSYRAMILRQKQLGFPDGKSTGFAPKSKKETLMMMPYNPAFDLPVRNFRGIQVQYFKKRKEDTGVTNPIPKRSILTKKDISQGLKEAYAEFIRDVGAARRKRTSRK